jgi:hypothetical protein
MSPGIERGHNRVEHIFIYFNGKNLSKSFQETLTHKNANLIKR